MADTAGALEGTKFFKIKLFLDIEAGFNNIPVPQ